MRPPLDGVVVVTGASSGIGREMAKLLAEEAKALVLVARRRARLEELATELRTKHPKLTVHIEERDLGQVSAILPMVESIKSTVGEIDVLVNNAGLGDISMFDLSDEKKAEGMITLNVTSLTLLTRAVIPGMVARKRGGILNVSSSFGLAFLPGFATYLGTKHYVTGFTEGLRADMRGTGVVVCQVCPGPVATEFEENAGNFTGQSVPGFVEISPERCARSAIGAFRRNKPLVIPGVVMRFLMLLNGLSPRPLRRFLAWLLAAMLRKRQLAAAHAAAPTR